MKKWRPFLISFFCFALTSHAAAGSTLSTLATVALTLSTSIWNSQGVVYDSFTKEFGGLNNEEGHGIFSLADDRAAVVGFTETDGAGEKDVLFNIYNTTSGELLLSKAIGGLGSETGYDVVDTHDGGFVIVGETDTAGAGLTDMLAMKINGAADTIEWAYAVGDAGDETARSVKRVPSDDGFIIAGYGDSYGTYDDGLLLNLDSAGAFSWFTALTGIHKDQFHAVAIDSLGNYKVVGGTQSYALENNDILVAQFNTTGSLDWAKRVSLFDETAYGVAMADDDSFAVVGCIFSLEVGYVEVFWRFDPANALVQAKSFGIGNIDCSTSIVSTDTGFALTGSSPQWGAQNYQMTVSEFSDIGDLEWFKIIGGSDEKDKGLGIAKNADGSLMVVGFTGNDNGNGDTNLLLNKLVQEGTADCSTFSIPPILDLLLIADESAILPTTSSPAVTVTDVKAQFTITDISTPVEVLTCWPTPSPTQATSGPTTTPSASPTQGTSGPTGSPTQGTSGPTGSPTQGTSSPTGSPTQGTSSPTGSPTQATLGPTGSPTQGTSGPTGSPTQGTSSPTGSPTQGTSGPTGSPTQGTSGPTGSPTQGTLGPTGSPTQGTSSPTGSPTQGTSGPTGSPTQGTSSPTGSPTQGTSSPTGSPTQGTSSPTGSPTQGTSGPTSSPTQGTSSPTGSPTQGTSSPTGSPTQGTSGPTGSPTQGTSSPTGSPTQGTSSPTGSPTQGTSSPTGSPTQGTSGPTDSPV